MMDEKLHRKLIKKWKKVGPGIYQSPKRINERMPFFLQFIGLFEGRDVLELGCNAGMYGYEIAKVATSYIGVDAGKYYIAQARQTGKHIEKQNATFIHSTVKDYVKNNINTTVAHSVNALFSSYALYHFSNKEIDELFYHVLPKCDIVMIQTRTQKRSKWKPYNKYKFWKPRNVSKWLQAAGFDCEIFWPTGKKFAEIIGKREHADEKPIPDNSEAVETQEGISDL